MRALLFILAFAACQSEKKADEWTQVPADRSTVLKGEDLDSFCREQEKKPGWTCDEYERCETVNTLESTVTCRAKP